MKRLGGFLLCLGLAATGALAEETWRCALKPETRFGWIAPVLVLVYDEADGSGAAFDGIVASVVGEPVPAEVRRRDARSVVVNWTVPDIPVSNRRSRLTGHYSAILWTGTGRIKVKVFLSGGTDMDPPHGSGSCQRVK